LGKQKGIRHRVNIYTLEIIEKHNGENVPGSYKTDPDIKLGREQCYRLKEMHPRRLNTTSGKSKVNIVKQECYDCEQIQL